MLYYVMPFVEGESLRDRLAAREAAAGRGRGAHHRRWRARWTTPIAGHCPSRHQAGEHPQLGAARSGRHARGSGARQEALALLRTVPRRGHDSGGARAHEAQLGRAAEARRTARELEEESRSRYIDPTYIAEIYTALGDRDTAFLWLERAYGAHAARLTWLQSQFRFAPLPR